MKYFLLLVGLYAVFSSIYAAEPRPIDRVISQQERITMPELGISIVLPQNTQIVGPRKNDEPPNYVFPWFRLPTGQIDIAIEPRYKEGILQDRVAEMVKQQKESHSPISILRTGTPMEIDGLTLIRVDCEGRNKYKIVRYYFLTPNEELAFLHLHGAPDMAALEAIVTTTMKKI